jgi:peptidoglycan/xylan/chitin deacetylase (PgdA/CDA1 family)
VILRAAVMATGVAALHAGPLAARVVEQRALARRCSEHGLLCLTYDDGPGERLTPRVLDALAEHEAQATFFAVGDRAAAAPQLLDRAVSEGHEVACHGYGHLNALKASPWRALRDVDRGYAALSPWVAPDAPFRPPYGKLTGGGWLALRRRRAATAWWTVESGDTADGHDVGRVVDEVRAAGGGVILMHDFDRCAAESDREDFVVELTHALLDTAAERKWSVETVGALL